MCAALVLAARGGDSGPERHVLRGKTSRGAQITITVVDGRLEDFRTQVSAWCPDFRNRIEWGWFRGYGRTTKFEQRGSRFLYGERAENRRVRPITTVFMTMQGELADGGKSARGRLQALAFAGPTSCEGSATFSAG